MKGVFYSFFNFYCFLFHFIVSVFKNTFEDINRDQDRIFYELLNAVPDYFVIFSIIFDTNYNILIISFYVLFQRKSNLYFYVLDFIWISFLILIIVSIPSVIFILQDLDLLPFWISGFENNSFYYKWIY